MLQVGTGPTPALLATLTDSASDSGSSGPGSGAGSPRSPAVRPGLSQAQQLTLLAAREASRQAQLAAHHRRAAEAAATVERELAAAEAIQAALQCAEAMQSQERSCGEWRRGDKALPGVLTDSECAVLSDIADDLLW